MNKELKSIFGTSIAVEGSSVPTAHLRYKGKSKTFVTWTVLGEEPALAGDDECLYSVVEVDVDIFSDKNYKEIVRTIKKLMNENEWVWTGDSPEMYEDDTELYHLTCTFKKERSLEWHE